MDQRKLLELQTKRGAKTSSYDIVTRSLDQVTNEARRRIEERSELYRDLDPAEKKQAIKQIVVDFAMEERPLVVGFIDNENRPDTLKLVDRLVEDITDYGILTAAITDDTVYELRCNGKEIKIEVAGRVRDLTDKEGNIVSFNTPEQQEIVIRKLLGDIRITPKDAIVNGSTIEGYRIAGVHSSAMSPDPNSFSDSRYHSFVLRKFRKSKMDLGAIVKFGTLSDNMARILALAPAGGLTFFTVGPTASGKTTLNNAILQAVPSTTRTILLQNPSEIDLRFRDASGRVYNDVLHLEAKVKENPLPSDPTMENLMDHTLRLSPTFVCFGELRSNKEFKMGMKIAQAGHPINCTFHSETSQGAVGRFLTAYLAESGNEPSNLALKNLTDLVHLIIVQKIMRDGTRKVIQISEVIGVDPTDKERALLNDLYVFDVNEDPELDSSGMVVNIRGEHKRVGAISDRMVHKFKLEGVSKKRFDFLLKDLNSSEKEEYTGVNINRYGI